MATAILRRQRGQSGRLSPRTRPPARPPADRIRAAEIMACGRGSAPRQAAAIQRYRNLWRYKLRQYFTRPSEIYASVCSEGVHFVFVRANEGWRGCLGGERKHPVRLTELDALSCYQQSCLKEQIIDSRNLVLLRHY